MQGIGNLAGPCGFYQKIATCGLCRSILPFGLSHMGGLSMQAKLLVFAATLAALFGWTSTASAQYGPGAGPYGGGGGYPSAPYGVAQFPGAMGMAAYQPAPPPEAPGAPGGIGCTDSACGCGDACCDDCCSGWCHRINVFGELLYLRRGMRKSPAVPINGNLAPGGQVQIGPWL
jgi:hypothetical protein